MDDSSKVIEQQMTVLFRRVQRIHLSTTDGGGVDIDRAGYGILCRLADDGPQRLGLIASGFGLDPSTITRQVQALERDGLAARQHDPADRRASILDLTPLGRSALKRTRRRRRERLQEIVEGWSAGDRAEFARLLVQFNESVESLA